MNGTGYVYRSSHRRCSARKRILRNFAEFTGIHLCQSLFFNIATGLRLLAKRGSGTIVFLWILRNFREHVFYRTPLGDCFCGCFNFELLQLSFDRYVIFFLSTKTFLSRIPLTSVKNPLFLVDLKTLEILRMSLKFVSNSKYEQTTTANKQTNF